MARNKVRSSVEASIKDGLAWAGMSGFVDPYTTPFALALGASSPFIGFLRAAPTLASAVAQLFNEAMVRRLGSCRDAIRLDVLVQALSLFIAAGAGLLPRGWALFCLTAAMITYTTAGNMAGPPWATLMGEYIPRARRGAFFGFRNQLVGLTFFAASLAAAKVLNFYPGVWAFSALFAAAGVFRLLSFHYIGRMYEPARGFHLPAPAAAPPEVNPGLRPFLASIFAVMFSAFLVAPFFSVYVLQDLGYGYVRYMVIMTVQPLVTYLLMRRWGVIADSFGSVRVLRTAFICIPLVPLMWALSPSFAWLFFTEVFSGAVWAAYGMGTNNLVYELGGPQHRTRLNALFGFTACLGQFAGAMTGGLLYAALPGKAFVALLLASAVLRTASILPFLRKVKEASRPAGARPSFLLAAIGFRSVDVYPAPPPKS